MAKKYVYTFGNMQAEGDAKMKNLLGGKGANLAQMCLLKLPVPAGFTITTECCTDYYANDCKLPDELSLQVWNGVDQIGKIMGAKYGDKDNPLLVSCRSGARISMPGMMDTVLNIGLSTATIPGLIKQTDNERFVYDSYRRLIMMYADVVMEKAEGKAPADGIGIRKILDIRLDNYKESKGYKSDTDLTSEDLKSLAEEFKAIIKEKLGVEFPDDAKEQLIGGVKAVFKSWMGDKAVSYRRIEKIPEDWGTAVNVQAMVFGNMGEDSATGVAFTRDPATGDNNFYGEWLINAQGEDVVAGIRTPNPLNNETKNRHNEHMLSLQESMPEVYKELCDVRNILERWYHDMLDIEFTIQHKKLYMLQCRVGKRTGTASVKMAMDMLKEGLITEQTSILRVSTEQLDELLHPILDAKDEENFKVIGNGLPAGPGGACGKIALSSEEAIRLNKNGEKAILVREETNPEDVEGMRAADGIFTARGGMTSHAALVARGWGKCCIVGSEDLSIDMATKEVNIGGNIFHEGDVISLNGSKGNVYAGEIKMVSATDSPLFKEFMAIVDKYPTLGVETNADNPADTQQALDFGAKGIGLFRIEHMFYGENSEEPLAVMRKIILSDTTEERKAYLNELLPYMKESVKSTLKIMTGKPVTIRLMDPPLHEFAPKDAAQQKTLAKKLGITIDELKTRIEALQEVNPMMGIRGVRLGILYPEISELQFRALFTAEAEARKEGFNPELEIMIPLTISVEELKHQKKLCDKIHAEVEKEQQAMINFKFGTMIEIPRATLVADQIAAITDFFSFGTNDLTQMTFGFSRDDVNSILADYTTKKILKRDPFQTIDFDGVGRLVKMAIESGRKTNPKLRIGVCGEHGGDSESVKFFYQCGINYVSCSPFRVPLARLAAAQASIERAE
ncbi:MAG: pyruvate, phosphate dikinase [Bacteroidales bacterium]|nr:pyruvate, phosphate dikinase [Bacteroidales bacterium]